MVENVIAANHAQCSIKRTNEDDVKLRKDIDAMAENIIAEKKSHESCPLPHASIKEIDHNASGREIKRRVSFDSINIREYLIELGDNPSCRMVHH